MSYEGIKKSKLTAWRMSLGVIRVNDYDLDLDTLFIKYEKGRIAIQKQVRSSRLLMSFEIGCTFGWRMLWNLKTFSNVIM